MQRPNKPPLAKPEDASTLSSSTMTGDIMALPRWLRNNKPKQAVTPDYSNQLDLFSEAPQDTPAPVESSTARSSGGMHGETTTASAT